MCCESGPRIVTCSASNVATVYVHFKCLLDRGDHFQHAKGINHPVGQEIESVWDPFWFETHPGERTSVAVEQELANLLLRQCGHCSTAINFSERETYSL